MELVVFVSVSCGSCLREMMHLILCRWIFLKKASQEVSVPSIHHITAPNSRDITRVLLLPKKKALNSYR